MFIVICGFVICVQAYNNLKKAVHKKYQTLQFNSIVAALELYKNKFGNYPPSSAFDVTGQHYCGVMKLCEAMMGQDFMGFHIESVFRRDGMNESGTDKLYGKEHIDYDTNVRMQPLLQFETANVHHLSEIYKDVGPFDGNEKLLCDTYLKKRQSGKKTGMPILYYKADTTKTLHDPNTSPTPADSMGNIYNYWDNHELVKLGKPGKKSGHGLADPARFYRNTKIHQVTTESRPYRRDSYILISAGYDGEYGTADDICNFYWKYRK